MNCVYILKSTDGDHFLSAQPTTCEHAWLRTMPRSAAYFQIQALARKDYVAFSDAEQALHFEKYLKSPSGRAFAKKRL